MSIELDACKFCGAKAVPNYYRGDHWVTCPQCKVGTATFGSAERAAASWNRRAQPAEEVQPVGEVVAWCCRLNMEGGQYDELISMKEYVGGLSPFGIAGIDYDESYTVTVTPLYTRPPAAEAEQYRQLLKECSATLKMWSDVAPAVSLIKDIDAALAASKEKKE